MSPGFTDSQLKAIVLVGWENGVSATVLAEFLKIKLPNCITEIVKPLTEKGIFYYGVPIKTSKRGRPRRLLHLKNNPYLLGNIRSELDNRIRACVAKSMDREFSEWHKLLKLFVQCSTYKNTKGIPNDNLGPNFIYDPDYSNGPVDPDFDEYWAVMVGNIDKFP